MSNFWNLQVWTYLSKPAVAFWIIYSYNVFVEGKNWKNSYNLCDGGIMAASSLVSKLVKDLITESLKMSPETMQYKLMEPVLNAVAIAYGYENFMLAKFLLKLICGAWYNSRFYNNCFLSS